MGSNGGEVGELFGIDLGQRLGVPGLDEVSHAVAGRVSAFVGDDDDLIGYVSRLESLADSGQLDDDDDDDEDDEEEVETEVVEAIDDTGLNSDELMAEVERFLRDQGGSP